MPNELQSALDGHSATDKVARLDDVIFGTAPNSRVLWSDGYDWIGRIELGQGIEEAIDRLLFVVRKAYVPAENSIITEFDDRLEEEASKNNYVQDDDVYDFLFDLKKRLVGILPGIGDFGDQTDSAILLETYGKITKIYPDIDPKPTFVDRVRNLMSPISAPTAQDVYKAVAGSISTHLDVSQEDGSDIEAERLATFSNMVEAIWAKVGPDGIDEPTSCQIADLRERIAMIADQTATPTL